MLAVQPEQLKKLFRVKLKEIRLDRGMTQAELAKKIEAHQPFVSALESGETSPTLETIAKLAEALKVAPRDLMPEEKIPTRA